MLTVDQALSEVLSRASPLPAASRPLAEALRCLLAEPVQADMDLPPFPKALVDGYAVRSADIQAGRVTRLQVGEVIPAGRVPSRPLGPGEAAAVMTGSPLPEGADAVVMVERTRCTEPGIVEIEPGAVGRWQNWIPRGREMRKGDLLLESGVRLNAIRLGLLASVGRTQVRVIPRPRVRVLPTGDELVEPSCEPGPGQIRNSNGILLSALAGNRAETLPIAPDEPGALRQALERGLEADVLLITGGVSAGTRDLVPGTLEALGVSRVFHKIRLKPGKPLWFGVGPARAELPGTLVFGLPGNPVSGIVGFLLLVQPALRALAGYDAGPATTYHHVRLTKPFVQRGDRMAYHPARLVKERVGFAVEPLDWGGSGDLRTVAGADGFAIFPAGDREYYEGETVDFLPLL